MPYLAELASGLDIFEWICDADLHYPRYSACQQRLALVLRLQMRRRSHPFLSVSAMCSISRPVTRRNYRMYWLFLHFSSQAAGWRNAGRCYALFCSYHGTQAVIRVDTSGVLHRRCCGRPGYVDSTPQQLLHNTTQAFSLQQFRFFVFKCPRFQTRGRDP